MILMVLRICKHLACENMKSVTLLSRRIKVHVASQDHQKRKKKKNKKTYTSNLPNKTGQNALLTYTGNTAYLLTTGHT